MEPFWRWLQPARLALIRGAQSQGGGSGVWICARCQVWCTCVPVGRAVVGYRDGEARIPGYGACVDTKVGLCPCAQGCGSVCKYLETCLRAQTWERVCTVAHVQEPGWFEDPKVFAEPGHGCGNSRGQGWLCVTVELGLTEHMCPWL